MNSGRVAFHHSRRLSLLSLFTLGACVALTNGCPPGSIQSGVSGPTRKQTSGPTPLASSDTGWSDAPKSGPRSPTPPRGPVTGIEVNVVHVRIPSDDAARVAKIWNYLREDAIPLEDQMRLRRNGLRIGIGNSDFWEPIKTALDVIEGHRVLLAQPLRVPAGFPIALELDEEPREQTLFWVDASGTLSGQTWPESRNVLRVTYAADPQFPDHTRLHIVPEIRQRLEGLRFIRTESGLWQVPKQYMRAFDGAGLTLSLAPDEFVLVTRDDAARTYGLLGDEFLSTTVEGTRYDSYVFLRPELKRAD